MEKSEPRVNEKPVEKGRSSISSAILSKERLLLKRRDSAMKRYGKIGGAVLVVAIVIGGLGFYYMFRPAPRPAPIEVGLPAAKDVPPVAGAKTSSENALPNASLPLPTLQESDDWFRQKMQGLSNYARLAEWLKLDHLIRRITAAVDNIAEGKSPRAHLPFIGPTESFTVAKDAQTLYLSAQSYRRYNPVADAFASLDAEKAVRTFRALKPVFQEAYRELGYPDRDFEKTLVRAIQELLRVPIVEGNISLEEEVVTYAPADEDLQNLSAAQKHLLRMGPQNTRKIQQKLRQVALALGVPQHQLARSS
jgi:hypothetical protein